MNKGTKIYGKSLILSFGITLLLHFFTLLLLSGYNVFHSPFFDAYARQQWNPYMFLYSYGSIFIFLFIEFITVFKIQGNSRQYKVWWIAGAVLATALLYGWIVSYLYSDLFETRTDLSARMFVGALIGNGFLSFVVMLISYIDYAARKQKITELENEALKAQNLQSRYEALKNQIDPHFLFNTFSSLTSMIELDPARAQEFSLRMSSVLRYTLQSKDLVTLEEEIEFARDYCSLMQIRFDKNLTVRFDIDALYNDFFVVPLSVQTLIENAIKHNEISSRAPLYIYVETLDNRMLAVTNGLNPKKGNARGTGLGLANLSERYMLKWKRKIQITSDNNVFRVTIPLIAPEIAIYESHHH